MWLIVAATILVAILLYKVLFPSNRTWEKHGVREIDTSPVISKLSLLLARQAVFEADAYVYKQLGSEKFAGLIEMGKPLLLVKDVELIKKIMIKDFDHFVDRRDFFPSHDKWIGRMLLFMKGEEWKQVRSGVSPTFTTGKIRRMMGLFNSVGTEWVEDLKEKAKAEGSVKVDILKTVNAYTIDVIASAAFGVNAGTIKNPNSTFAKYAHNINEIGPKQLFKFIMNLIVPQLFDLFKITMFDYEAIAFFQRLWAESFKSRMSGDVRRNDFLQLLVEAKKGELKGVGNDELDAFEEEAQIGGLAPPKQWFTEEVLSAQSMVFFIGGFSSASNFITFAAYELAVHQDVQNRLRKEVDKIVKPDGTFDYDDLGTLVYLDMVACEVNRLFPGGARLERVCVKEYTEPETSLVVPKGTIVAIPVESLHHDSQYYPNPDVFDPENFTPARKAERNPYVYMPFGVGPRSCIGMRFALIESKAAIAHLVHNFVIEPTKKTPLPVQGRTGGFQVLPPKGLELKLTPVH